MILLLFLIILFAYFVLVMKRNIHLFEPFTNFNSILKNSSHFNSYIKSIHPEMYSVKIKNLNKNSFYTQYLDKLR